ncbi:GTPase activating protein Rap1-GAP [Thecamonas trahens ATCC 50062]|uniref:GTPase activating protein Rap1-GAP n=1 Tax=Thecamonas trahens ATCC 50062 TaxID=461836 RepID=A0A0L0DD85_THETB|nr:GTPase activating protein Rap1-GAP [Thecamonas trahens ATCC 50062]KNC50307.1 GTPase activating protein Rap1-GAP [Thecamonas trahens ATCC 50062]|eukprot:XP_013756854.1 GTPase activating protein Rap1-GAP [Thecamonas trahens ATCC 50062]
MVLVLILVKVMVIAVDCILDSTRPPPTPNTPPPSRTISKLRDRTTPTYYRSSASLYNAPAAPLARDSMYQGMPLKDQERDARNRALTNAVVSARAEAASGKTAAARHEGWSEAALHAAIDERLAAAMATTQAVLEDRLDAIVAKRVATAVESRLAELESRVLAQVNDRIADAVAASTSALEARIYALESTLPQPRQALLEPPAPSPRSRRTSTASSVTSATSATSDSSLESGTPLDDARLAEASDAIEARVLDAVSEQLSSCDVVRLQFRVEALEARVLDLLHEHKAALAPVMAEMLRNQKFVSDGDLSGIVVTPDDIDDDEPEVDPSLVRRSDALRIPSMQRLNSRRRSSSLSSMYLNKLKRRLTAPTAKPSSSPRPPPPSTPPPPRVITPQTPPPELVIHDDSSSSDGSRSSVSSGRDREPASASAQLLDTPSSARTRASSVSDVSQSLVPGVDVAASDGKWVAVRPVPRLDVETVDLGVAWDECDLDWYTKYFSGKPTVEFVGEHPSEGVVSVSIVSSFDEHSGEPEYKAVVRKSSGFSTATLPKTAVKISRFKSKPKASSLLKAFVPELVREAPMVSVKPKLVQPELVYIEEQLRTTTYKFGVLLCKEGQSDEADMLTNAGGSADFEEFLAMMGETIPLVGHTGYTGGLDTRRGGTGSHSIYTRWKQFEIMFHVSTMLPLDDSDSQQLQRKRHIGNDVVLIVFLDGERDDLVYPAHAMASHFTHLIIAVQKHQEASRIVGETTYQISVASHAHVPPEFESRLPDPPLFPHSPLTRDFILSYCVNGERAALLSQGFKPAMDRTRKAYLEALKAYAEGNGHSLVVH